MYFFEDFSTLCVWCRSCYVWEWGCGLNANLDGKARRSFSHHGRKIGRDINLLSIQVLLNWLCHTGLLQRLKSRIFKICTIYFSNDAAVLAWRREEIFFKVLCINSTEALIKLWTHPPKNYNLVSVITSFQIPTPYYIVLKDFILAYKTHTVHWKRKNNCQSIFDFLNLSSTCRINEDFCSTP